MSARAAAADDDDDNDDDDDGDESWLTTCRDQLQSDMYQLALHARVQFARSADDSAPN